MRACDAQGLLDLTTPIGLLMDAVLEGIPQSSDLARMVADYRERIAPESHLVISHFTGDHRPAETAAVVELMRSSSTMVHPRTHEEVSRCSPVSSCSRRVWSTPAGGIRSGRSTPPSDWLRRSTMWASAASPSRCRGHRYEHAALGRLRVLAGG